MQTFNFAYVAEKNRVVVVSVASFMWTIFLSYMHHMQQDSLPGFLHKKKSTQLTSHEEWMEITKCQINYILAVFFTLDVYIYVYKPILYI